MSNWEKFKKKQPAVAKNVRVTPTTEQLKKAAEYNNQLQAIKEKRRQKLLASKAKQAAPVASTEFQFIQQVKYDRFTPVIVSHLSCAVQKAGTTIRQEHVCYVQFYDTKTGQVTFESFIQPPAKYEVADPRSALQRISADEINEGKPLSDVAQAASAVFSADEFYVGFRTKNVMQLLRLETLSSHIIELQTCQCFQGDGGCGSLYQLLVNSGLGFSEKLKTERLGPLGQQLYDMVRFKLDFEVAAFYKARGQ